MKTIRLALALLLAAVAVPHFARAAEAASVHAILITATNLKREADPKLAEFEAELQRNLPLSSFRYVTEGTTALSATKNTTVRLGRSGHLLLLEGEKADGSIHVKVQWMNGKEVIMNTTLVLKSGVPAVLGRRPSGDADTPIIIVIAK